MKNKTIKGTILVGDSCVGGFGVLKELIKWSGDYKIAYIADYEKNPFGLKSKKEIAEIVNSWFVNLVESNSIRLVVLACNTASIASYNILKKLSEKYGIPVVSMVEGVEKCIEANGRQILNKNVAIMATKYTIESEKYSNIIKKYKPSEIINIIGTQSEHAVATGKHNSDAGKILINQDLMKYKNSKIDTLILGCTCLPLITNHIKAVIGKKVVFLDPAIYVSKLAREALGVKDVIPNQNICIYNTSTSAESYSSIEMCSQNIFGDKLNVSGLYLER